ncbi:DNA translocase FtsK 4TM domain-containing protein [Patescibacteria group bacterium]|nr:DNA translocase FtsK 4TM domain-containing protein [Patescibacteria group bacterium]
MSKKKKKRRIKYEKIKLDLELNPETSREIIAFIIGIVTLFLVLSFIGQLGPVGQITKTLILTAFGLIAYSIPIFLIIFGLNAILPGRFELHTRQIISIVIFLIVSPGLLAQIIPTDDHLAAGGYIGKGFIFLGHQIIGSSGTLILIIFLVIISFLLFFNTSLQNILSQFPDTWPRFRWPKFRSKSSDETVQINTFQPNSDESKSDLVPKSTPTENQPQSGYIKTPIKTKVNSSLL